MCPSDFINENDEYVLRFSYPIQCSKSCPTPLIADGNCDKNCNTITCGYDGGDCAKGKPYKVDLTNSKRVTYPASLDFVNIKFNQKFGPKGRYNVPHIPILIDVDIITGTGHSNTS